MQTQPSGSFPCFKWGNVQRPFVSWNKGRISTCVFSWHFNLKAKTFVFTSHLLVFLLECIHYLSNSYRPICIVKKEKLFFVSFCYGPQGCHPLKLTRINNVCSLYRGQVVFHWTQSIRSVRSRPMKHGKTSIHAYHVDQRRCIQQGDTAYVLLNHEKNDAVVFVMDMLKNRFLGFNKTHLRSLLVCFRE